MTQPHVSRGPLTGVVSARFLHRRVTPPYFVIKDYFVRRRCETGSLSHSSPNCPFIHLVIAGWIHVSYCIQPLNIIHA